MLEDNWTLKLQNLFSKFRLQIILLLIGIIFLGIGIFITRGGLFETTKIEVLEKEKNQENLSEIVVEIAGEVLNPGVYHLTIGSRIDDLLIASGGFSLDADRVWIEKNINRAKILTDGQKVYIPSINQSKVLSANNQTTNSNVAQSEMESESGLININTASSKQLESLSGIGPTYAQKIIDQRPYSDVSELISKKVIPQSTFNKIKDKIIVY